MRNWTKLGLAIATAGLTLTGCGGGDSDGGSNTSNTNSVKSYPWILLLNETDVSDDAVIQRLDRVTVNDVMYNKTPVRIVGGQTTIDYYNNYYFNADFFFVQPTKNTKYGKPTYLVSDLTNSKMVVSPYNDKKKKYITHTFNYKTIDLSGKPVASANDNVLSGQNISLAERFPNGAKCRSLISWDSEINVGDNDNKDVYFSFSDDSSSRTSYSSLDQWEQATLASTNISDSSLEIIDAEFGDNRIPVRYISDITSDEFYIAAFYNNRVYNVTTVETGLSDPGIPNSCIDYNSTATNFITEVAKDNFRARPINRLAPTTIQDVEKLAHANAKLTNRSDIKAAFTAP